MHNVAPVSLKKFSIWQGRVNLIKFHIKLLTHRKPYNFKADSGSASKTNVTQSFKSRWDYSFLHISALRQTPRCSLFCDKNRMQTLIVPWHAAECDRKLTGDGKQKTNQSGVSPRRHDFGRFSAGYLTQICEQSMEIGSLYKGYYEIQSLIFLESWTDANSSSVVRVQAVFKTVMKVEFFFFNSFLHFPTLS